MWSSSLTFDLPEWPSLSSVRKIATVCALILVALIPAQLRGQFAASVTLVKAGALLDPRTGNVLTPAVVLIEGNKIKQVGSSADVGTPIGATIIDLGSA